MKPTDDDNEAKRTNIPMSSMTATTFKTIARQVLSETAHGAAKTNECHAGNGSCHYFDCRHRLFQKKRLPLHRRPPVTCREALHQVALQGACTEENVFTRTHTNTLKTAHNTAQHCTKRTNKLIFRCLYSLFSCTKPNNLCVNEYFFVQI